MALPPPAGTPHSRVIQWCAATQRPWGCGRLFLRPAEDGKLAPFLPQQLLQVPIPGGGVGHRKPACFRCLAHPRTRHQRGMAQLPDFLGDLVPGLSRYTFSMVIRSPQG